jgi:hypothetical protein
VIKVTEILATDIAPHSLLYAGVIYDELITVAARSNA